ncbi:MAG: hypothetical protein GX996_08915 [Firmicutes bacterium]|nr:hypothetical protein [Bacillota bacterium]
MTVLNKVTITRKLEPYFLKEKNPKSTIGLLKAVRLAWEDIKKKEPAITGLDLTEISFSRKQAGEINLTFYFE